MELEQDKKLSHGFTKEGTIYGFRTCENSDDLVSSFKLIDRYGVEWELPIEALSFPDDVSMVTLKQYLGKRIKFEAAFEVYE